jgi:hypothetical protein
VNPLETDPNDHFVGFGVLPNLDGEGRRSVQVMAFVLNEDGESGGRIICAPGL